MDGEIVSGYPSADDGSIGFDKDMSISVTLSSISMMSGIEIGYVNIAGVSVPPVLVGIDMSADGMSFFGIPMDDQFQIQQLAQPLHNTRYISLVTANGRYRAKKIRLYF